MSDDTVAPSVTPDGWLVHWRDHDEPWDVHHAVSPVRTKAHAEDLAQGYSEQGYETMIRPFRYTNGDTDE